MQQILAVVLVVLACINTGASTSTVIDDPSQLSPNYTLIGFEGIDPFTIPVVIGEATFRSITGTLSAFDVSHWPANGTEIQSTTLFPGAEPDSAISIEFETP